MDGRSSTSPATSSVGSRSEKTALSVEQDFNLDATPSQSLSFDLQLSAIRTPEVVSTPLSAAKQSDIIEEVHSSESRGRSWKVISEQEACPIAQDDSVGISPHGEKESSFLSDLEQLNDSLRNKEGHDEMTEGVEEDSVRSGKAIACGLTSTASDTSDIDLRLVPSFNLDEEDEGVGVTYDPDRNDTDVHHHTEEENPARNEEMLSKACVSAKLEVEETGSHDSDVICVDSSSDDDENDADGKLEKCKSLEFSKDVIIMTSSSHSVF